MSESTSTTPQKPPAASMLDALHEISGTLTTVQDKWAGLGSILTDLRDIVQESTTLLHEEMGELRQQVDRLTQQTARAPVHERPWWRAHLTVLVTGILVLGGLLVGLAWWPLGATTPRLEALARDLDGTLVQGYAQLPKGLQDKINSLYAQHFFQSPGKRQGGGK